MNTVKFQFNEPIVSRGKVVDEVVLREPRMGEIQIAMRKHSKDSFSFGMRLLELITGLAPKSLDNAVLSDIQRLQDAYQPFIQTMMMSAKANNSTKSGKFSH